MAQRIKLDLDSTDSLDFEVTVSIPTPDGKPLRIPFTFRYRDRVDTAKLFDTFRERAEATPDETDAALAAIVTDALESDAEMLIDIASDWGIDLEWNRDNARKFCRRYAGAARAVLSEYRTALTQGRLGN